MDGKLLFATLLAIFTYGIIPFFLGLFSSFAFSALAYIAAEHVPAAEHAPDIIEHMAFKVVFSAAVALLFWIYFRSFIRNNVMEAKRDFVFFDHTNIRLKLFGVFKHVVAPLLMASIFFLCIGARTSVSHFSKIQFPENAISVDIIPVEVEQSHAGSFSPSPDVQTPVDSTGEFPGTAYDADYSGKRVFAFYQAEYDRSRVSLQDNVGNMDIVLPDWYTFNADGTINISVQTEIDDLLRKNQIKIMPSLSNYIDGKWDAEAVHALLAEPSARTRLIENIYLEVKKSGYWGINLNIFGLEKEYKEGLTGFVKELCDKFYQNGLRVSQNIPVMDEAYDSVKLSRYLDYVLFLVYGEHGMSSSHGPIASFQWLNGIIEDIKTPWEKTVICVGGYGYSWNTQKNNNAVEVGFTDVMDFAGRHALKAEWDKESGNPYLVYMENGEEHIIWFLDGSTFYNSARLAFARGAAGIGLWKLGGEDPVIWKMAGDMGNVEKNLELPHNYQESSQSSMKRSIAFDEEGFVDKQTISFTANGAKWDAMLRDTKDGTASKAADSRRLYAFYTGAQEAAQASLEKNIGNIDVLIPHWYSLNEDGTLSIAKQPEIDRLVYANNKQILPMINNYIDGAWDSAAVHRLISDPAVRDGFIERLHADIVSSGYIGVNLDFENIAEEDRELWTAFIKEISRKFHSSGLQVTQDIAVIDKAFDYKILSEYEDYFFYMLYDQRSGSSAPGPIASAEWLGRMLKEAEVPNDKIVVCIGNYGYDWRRADNTAKVLSYDDAVKLAGSNGIPIKWDIISCNPYFTYRDKGGIHDVWFMDGATFYNTAKMAFEKGVAGIALWQAGSEDPAVWEMMEGLKNTEAPGKKLDRLTTLSDYLGDNSGHILLDFITGNDGKRDIKISEDGFIYDIDYTPPVPSHFKKAVKTREKDIVLSFSGGPDIESTPEILDLLKKRNIKASFFITGKDALKYPELVKRIYREGHELGSLPFSGNELKIPLKAGIKHELKLTHYLTEIITGRGTLFYQLPGHSDIYRPDKWSALREAQLPGYVLVDSSFFIMNLSEINDTATMEQVWKELSHRSVLTISGGYEHDQRNISVLKDAIEILLSKGYSFVQLSDVLRVNREEAMPEIRKNTGLQQLFMSLLIWAYSFLYNSFRYIFPITIIMGIARLLLFICLSLKHKRSSAKHNLDDSYQPRVSVLIAAYNEEVVICSAVGSLLQSDYPDFEIIIVNDGSTDRTSEAIRGAFGAEPRVKLFEQDNRGKIAAVNFALQKAEGEIIITVDADTIVAKDSIRLLARHFKDEKVAAVAGNIKVANRNKLMAVFQHIEYVYSFNLERRAYSAINANVVVPGCNGAWRKCRLMEEGLFGADTIAEDTDMPIIFLEKGYKIMYEEKALAYTEAPDTVRDLFKQRSRWYFGILQVLWKHRRLLVKGKNKWVRFVTLANSWIYGLIYQAMVPLVDTAVLLQLVAGLNYDILLIYAMLLAADLWVTIYAFRLENEKLRPLLWAIPMKLFYRYMMSYMVIISCFNAFKGKPLNWNKLKRLGIANIEASDINQA